MSLARRHIVFAVATAEDRGVSLPGALHRPQRRRIARRDLPGARAAGTITFSFFFDAESTTAPVPSKLALSVRRGAHSADDVTERARRAPCVGVNEPTDSVGLNLALLDTLPVDVSSTIFEVPAPSGTVASICVGEDTV